jgi:hypothetical protein
MPGTNMPILGDVGHAIVVVVARRQYVSGWQVGNDHVGGCRRGGGHEAPA